MKNPNNYLYHKKNPLKFEPYKNSEYKVNHHNIRYDYYDQNDSSGESFEELFKRQKWILWFSTIIKVSKIMFIYNVILNIKISFIIYIFYSLYIISITVKLL